VQVRFVISASPRSGTKFVSVLLSNLGIKCGHEQVFNRKGINKSAEFMGDSSWLSAAYLRKIKKNIIVIHQVRNPLNCINSIISHGGFFDAHERKAKRPISTNDRRYQVNRFIRRNIKVKWSQHKRERVSQFWYYWNKKIEKYSKYNYLMVKAESLYTFEGVDKLLKILRCSCSKHDIENAIANMLDNPNKGKSKKRLEIYDKYENLPQYVKDLGLKYGYKNA